MKLSASMVLLEYELFNLRLEHVNHIRFEFEPWFHGACQFQVLFKLFFLLNFFNVHFILFFDIFHGIDISTLFLILIISIHESHAIDLGYIHLWTCPNNLTLICPSSIIGENLLFLTWGWNATRCNISTWGINTNECTLSFLLTNGVIFTKITFFFKGILIFNLIWLRWNLILYGVWNQLVRLQQLPCIIASFWRRLLLLCLLLFELFLESLHLHLFG